MHFRVHPLIKYLTFKTEIMANICDTTYQMLGSKKSIESLWKVLSEMEVNTKNLWLGDIAEHCGIDYKELKYDVRGEIYFAAYSDLEQEDYMMEIKTSSKWTGCHEIMRAIIEKAGGEDISVSYMEVEPGCEIYVIHDEQNLLPYECYVTASGIFEECEGEYNSIDSAIETWVKITKNERLADNDRMLELIEENNDSEDCDNYFSIHPFEYV